MEGAVRVRESTVAADVCGGWGYAGGEKGTRLALDADWQPTAAERLGKQAAFRPRGRRRKSTDTDYESRPLLPVVLDADWQPTRGKTGRRGKSGRDSLLTLIGNQRPPRASANKQLFVRVAVVASPRQRITSRVPFCRVPFCRAGFESRPLLPFEFAVRENLSPDVVFL